MSISVSADPLVRLAVAGAGVQLATTLAALVAERSGADRVLIATSIVHFGLFTVGATVLFLGFLAGLARSRTEEVGVGALFFLADSGTPRQERRTIYAAVVAQIVIGIVGASLAPLSPVAFTTLAPAFGFGVMALYGSRHSVFQPTETDTSIGE